MKISCGTDIVKIDRIGRAIEKYGDKFLNAIFCDEEIKYCEKYKENKYQHYAVRFAAKEATFKALTRIFNDVNTVDWKNIKVINRENGRPMVYFEQKDNKRIQGVDISLSHSEDSAVATVMILFE